MYCYTPCDLHALATPPAFTVSQDQTLQLFVVPLVIVPDHRSLTVAALKAFPRVRFKGEKLAYSKSIRKVLRNPSDPRVTCLASLSLFFPLRIAPQPEGLLEKQHSPE